MRPAQDYRRAHGDEDGLYRLDLNPSSQVAPITLDTFRGWELEMPQPKRRSKWLNTVWINGRNALVYDKDGRVAVEAYALDGEGRPNKLKAATFDRGIDAQECGRLWVAKGHWKQCTLCRCESTGEVCGLPVCDYHGDHTEDDPRCPNCAGKHTCERCGRPGTPSTSSATWRCATAAPTWCGRSRFGDRVRDPIDGTWREVVRH